MGQLSNSFYGYYKFNLHHDLNITFQFCPENIHTHLDGTTYGSIMITLQKKEVCAHHFDLHPPFCRLVMGPILGSARDRLEIGLF